MRHTLIDALPELLVTPDRQWPEATPHSYSHLGETVLSAVTEEYPDLPVTRREYKFRPLPTDTESTLGRLARLGRI